VLQVRTNASNAYTPGEQGKAAMSVATNSTLMDFNATAQTPDTSCLLPTTSQLDMGHLAGSSQLNGAVGPTFGWVPLKSQSELGAVDR
jgi:hypothetical protein